MATLAKRQNPIGRSGLGVVPRRADRRRTPAGRRRRITASQHCSTAPADSRAISKLARPDRRIACVEHAAHGTRPPHAVDVRRRVYRQQRTHVRRRGSQFGERDARRLERPQVFADGRQRVGRRHQPRGPNRLKNRPDAVGPLGVVGPRSRGGRIRGWRKNPVTPAKVGRPAPFGKVRRRRSRPCRSGTTGRSPIHSPTRTVPTSTTSWFFARRHVSVWRFSSGRPKCVITVACTVVGPTDGLVVVP